MTRGRVVFAQTALNRELLWIGLRPESLLKSLYRSIGLHQSGAIAQLGERVVRNDEAVGSIPTSSTKFSTQNTRLKRHLRESYNGRTVPPADAALQAGLEAYASTGSVFLQAFVHL